MDKHYGQIVEYTVRRNGFNISELSAQLNVNRRTIYNWFQRKDLRVDVIQKIGLILRHDFSKELPELFTSEDFSDKRLLPKFQADDTLSNFKEKYITLLEQYNKILLSLNNC